MVIRFVMALVLGTPVPADASDWRLIWSGSSASASLDWTSIVNAGRFREGWLKLRYTKADQNGVIEIKQLFQVDCQAHEFAIRSHITYKANGDVGESHSVSGDVDVPGSPVAPDTLGSAAFDTLCGMTGHQ